MAFDLCVHGQCHMALKMHTLMFGWPMLLSLLTLGRPEQGGGCKRRIRQIILNGYGGPCLENRCEEIGKSVQVAPFLFFASLAGQVRVNTTLSRLCRHEPFQNEQNTT